MNEEKIKIADNINSLFRQYEKIFSKMTKKHSVKKEIHSEKKSNPNLKETMKLFHDLVSSISKENPSNAIALMKLWKYNSKINDSIIKKFLNDKKNSMGQINTKVREIVVEWNNLFKLLDWRNQDILSLIEYIGETNESIEQLFQ